MARAYDVLLDDDGTGMVYMPVMNYEQGDMAAVREMLTHPLSVPGLGDAGAHCTMICDASFATYLLQYWTSDAPAAQRLDVEWVVQRQTAATAAPWGCTTAAARPRDPGRHQPHRPRPRRRRRPRCSTTSLPAASASCSGPRLRATVVAGAVIRDGEDTGALPGRLVRGARAL